jgi:hypothetical protein
MTHSMLQLKSFCRMRKIASGSSKILSLLAVCDCGAPGLPLD